MKSAFDYVVEGTGGFPIALVVSEKQFVVLIDPDACRRAQACGKGFELAFRGNLEAPTAILGRSPHLAFRVLVTSGPNSCDIPLFASGPTWPTQGGIQGAIEISLTVAHQAKGVLVIVVGYSPVSVKAFVKVGSSITVGIETHRIFYSVAVRIDHDTILNPLFNETLMNPLL